MADKHPLLCIIIRPNVVGCCTPEAAGCKHARTHARTHTIQNKI